MTHNNVLLSSSDEDKQAAILAYFRSYQAQHSRPPTVREVSLFLGSDSPSVASYHLNQLVEQEKLVRHITGTRRYTLPTKDVPLSKVLLELRTRVAEGEEVEHVLRQLTLDYLNEVEREVFDMINSTMQITAEDLGDYLNMPQKRLWAALDRLMELQLIVREHDEYEHDFVYRVPALA